MKTLTATVEPGDRVGYAPDYLRSRRLSFSALARARGRVATVRTIGQIPMAVVEWESPFHLPELVAVYNLAKISGTSVELAVF